jgi:hypothetical protein
MLGKGLSLVIGRRQETDDGRRKTEDRGQGTFETTYNEKYGGAMVKRKKLRR